MIVAETTPGLVALLRTALMVPTFSANSLHVLGSSEARGGGIAW